MINFQFPVSLHTHTHTHMVLQIIYASSLVGLTSSSHLSSGLEGVESKTSPDKLVAYFAIIHVLVWAVVGVFDRCVHKVDQYIVINMCIGMKWAG